MNTMRRLISVLCSGVLLCGAAVGFGQDNLQRESPGRSGFSRDGSGREFGPRGMNPQGRMALMEYVKKHNPPAARLLNQLERSSPGQFRQALQSLERDVENLRNYELRDPERFELALKQWRNRTNIEILLAQVARGQESPRTRQQLQRLLEEQRQVRRDWMNLELIALEKRAEKLREQLAQMPDPSESDQQKIADDMMRRAKLSAQRMQRGPQNADSKPAADQPPRDDQ